VIRHRSSRYVKGVAPPAWFEPGTSRPSNDQEMSSEPRRPLAPRGGQQEYGAPRLVRSISRLGSASERDDVCNLGERTNATIAYEASKASLREVLGPKAAFCHEIFAGLLQHGVSQPAIPFSPGRH
jgi:hypothetical protein